MELTFKELTLGKPTRIKNREYLATEAYVSPFIERMSQYTDEFIIQARLPDQISLTKNNDINFDDIVYNRVWIQAVLPNEYALEGHKKVVSMLYALDARKPVVKFYSGAIRSACLNLCVFDPECIDVKEIEPETPLDYRPINRIMEWTDTIHSTLKMLSERTITRDKIFFNLGKWVDNCITASYNSQFGKVKLAESTPIDAYKDLFYNKDSEYFVNGNEVDMLTVYNAFTQQITNDSRDLVNKFEKTLLLKGILDI